VIYTVIILDLLVIIKKRMTSCFIVYWGRGGGYILRECVCLTQGIISLMSCVGYDKLPYHE